MKAWLRAHRLLTFGLSGWAFAALAIYLVLWTTASGWMWAIPILGTLWLVAAVWFVLRTNGGESKAKWEEKEQKEAYLRYSDPDRAYGAPW